MQYVVQTTPTLQGAIVDLPLSVLVLMDGSCPKLSTHSETVGGRSQFGTH